MASAFGPRVPWAGTPMEEVRAWDSESDVWELFNTTTDYNLLNDVSKENPGVVV